MVTIPDTTVATPVAIPTTPTPALYPETFPRSWNLDYSADTKLLLIEYSLPNIDALSKLKEVRRRPPVSLVGNLAREPRYWPQRACSQLARNLPPPDSGREESYKLLILRV